MVFRVVKSRRFRGVVVVSGGRRRVLRVPTSRGWSSRVRVISLVGVAPDRFPFSFHGLQPTIAPFVSSSHDPLHCRCSYLHRPLQSSRAGLVPSLDVSARGWRPSRLSSFDLVVSARWLLPCPLLSLLAQRPAFFLVFVSTISGSYSSTAQYFQAS